MFKYLSKRIIIMCFMLLFVNSIVVAQYHYGLYFKSHSVPGNNRTSLSLNDNKPFAVTSSLTLSAMIMVRSSTHEPDFGNIVRFACDNGQSIRLTLAPDDKNVNKPAILFNEGMILFNKAMPKNKWLSLSLTVNISKNILRVRYEGTDTTLVVPLSNIKRMSASFGFGYEMTDVAPIDLRDLRINIDGSNKYHWILGRHNGDICYDELNSKIARAQNPKWMIESHISWQQIYNRQITDKFDVAFDETKALFYIIYDNRIEVFDEMFNYKKTVDVEGGYRAINFPEHSYYDSSTNEIVSYSLYSGYASRFSFKTHRWSMDKPNMKEPHYYNHARMLNSKDGAYYCFGGYGFYRYHNELFRIRRGQTKVEKIAYSKVFSPRFGAAMGIMNNEIYLFGGKGNRQGRQEATSQFFGGLSCIDLRTHVSRIIWNNNPNDSIDYIVASSMFYNPKHHSFYVLSLQNGGMLYEVSVDKPSWKAVSRGINNNEQFQDGDFNLYYSPTHCKFFVVMNKLLSNHAHLLSIYSLDTPLLSEVETQQKAGNDVRWTMMWIGIIVAVLFSVMFFYLKGKKRNQKNSMPKSALPISVSSEDTNEVSAINEMEEPSARTFDSSHSAILLYGSFNVKDKEGNDITALFTPRIKNLLIISILFSEKYSDGISSQKLTDTLWFDKDDLSARNNRNVTLRHLRMILEKIGDVRIIYENGYMRIWFGNDVFCDYHKLHCILKENSVEQLCSEDMYRRQVLEILLNGPLLPNIEADWLDDFKSDNSSISLDILTNMLNIMKSKDDDMMVLRITDIMFHHDPLNEEALSAKIKVLLKQGKKGVARSIYDHFCKEYHDMMAENFDKSFTDICDK